MKIKINIWLWILRIWWVACVPFAAWVVLYNATRFFTSARFSLAWPVNWTIVSMSVILMPLLFCATLILLALVKNRSAMTKLDKIGLSIPGVLSLIVILVTYVSDVC